jgi:hypothetical protein
MSLGNDASLNGFVPFPATNVWDTNIASAPVDSNSAAITSAAGFAGLYLHPDFGSTNGIPYVVVDSTQTPAVPIDVAAYAGQSDVVVAPYPITAPIEGNPADCTGGPGDYIEDSHVLVLDRSKCWLYETFNTRRCNGQWTADSETIWDLHNYESRPWGWTSADAAGLPIFPGLLRYDEILSGAIHHAIRFTMQQTKDDANGGYFVYPASHAAGNIWGVSNVMGMRIRLKASFDISGFSKTNQIILTAMKQYGMILADNGGYFFFQGVPDPRWDDNDMDNLKTVASSNFEVVQMTPPWPGYDSAKAPTGAVPVINSFTESSSTVASGSPVTFTYSVSGDSYDFIDMIGPVTAGSGSVTVNPTATQTYTLNSTNAYGRSTSIPLTVTVSGAAATAASPIFSLAAGAYSLAQTVTLSDTTTGATIYYTTDGSTPTSSSTPYTGAITVSSTETIQAIAVAAGYANSAVASATYTLNLPTPGFSVALSPASLTVNAGSSGTATISVTPLNGFNAAVLFGCSGLPSGASCSFSPTTVTPSGATASTTLTVTVPATTATLGRNRRPLFPAAALAAILCCFGRKKRRRLQLLLLLTVSGIGLSLLNGCNSGGSITGPSSPQPSTSTVTVSATSGSLESSATFSLTVNRESGPRLPQPAGAAHSCMLKFNGSACHPGLKSEGTASPAGVSAGSLK